MRCSLVEPRSAWCPTLAAASSCVAVGQFELVPAAKVRAGNKLVVTLKDKAGATSFAAVQVDEVVKVSAKGLYLPVIEQPYIVVDGVVAPL
jgi:hypothetical protein